jgi:small glutamine-rich tetratricopeptide repeat-containing protein alpha
VHCYQRAVELEPENESYQSNLQIAEEKLRSSGGPAAGVIPSIPGIPDLGGMLNNPGESYSCVLRHFHPL